MKPAPKSHPKNLNIAGLLIRFRHVVPLAIAQALGDLLGLEYGQGWAGQKRLLTERFDAEDFAETLLPCPRNGQGAGIVLALHPVQFECPVEQGSTHRTRKMKTAFAPI